MDIVETISIILHIPLMLLFCTIKRKLYSVPLNIYAFKSQIRNTEICEIPTR